MAPQGDRETTARLTWRQTLHADRREPAGSKSSTSWGWGVSVDMRGEGLRLDGAQFSARASTHVSSNEMAWAAQNRETLAAVGSRTARDGRFAGDAARRGGLHTGRSVTRHPSQAALRDLVADVRGRQRIHIGCHHPRLFVAALNLAACGNHRVQPGWWWRSRRRE